MAEKPAYSLRYLVKKRKHPSAQLGMEEAAVPFLKDTFNRQQLCKDYHRVVECVPDELWLGEKKEVWIVKMRENRKNLLDEKSQNHQQ